MEDTEISLESQMELQVTVNYRGGEIKSPWHRRSIMVGYLKKNTLVLGSTHYHLIKGTQMEAA